MNFLGATNRGIGRLTGRPFLLMRWQRLFPALFAVWVSLLTGVPAFGSTPIISEFMASNDTTITDQDGDYADWLELYNPGPSAANLNGWYLTNKASKPTKWQIPAVTLPA